MLRGRSPRYRIVNRAEYCLSAGMVQVLTMLPRSIQECERVLEGS